MPHTLSEFLYRLLTSVVSHPMKTGGWKMTLPLS